MGRAIVVSGLLLLAGCATMPVQDQLLFCDAATAMRPAPSESERLSPTLRQQLATHNRMVAQVCGVRP